MAMLDFSFQSDVLGFEQGLCVLLPEPKVLKLAETGRPDPTELTVLYLLHGYHGNYMDWVRRTMVTRHLEESKKKLAIVMPSGFTYHYCDMVRGWRFYTYVLEEVPAIVESYLHITSDPENTYVAGLSMGGAGAMKLALRNPERFAGAASFSGPLDSIGRALEHCARDPERKTEFENLFGPDQSTWRDSENDVLFLLEQAAKSGKKLPKLYASCGTADSLYHFNIDFKNRAAELGVPLDFYEEEGVAHEWRFWDSEVKKLIDRIPAPTAE